MKKLNKTFALVSILLLLTGCGSASSNNLSEETSDTANADIAIDSTLDLASEYGEFSITPETGYESNVSYDETNNIYTIAVDATKVTYVIKGYFAGQIFIDDVNDLSDTDDGYKGVCLELQDACLVSQDENPVINYDVKKKNVEIKSKKDTANRIIAYGTTNAVESKNNVELSGKGSLSISTNSEHAIQAEGDITLTSSGTYTITSHHDGFHSNNFFSSDDEGVAFDGTITFKDITSQAIEATDDDNVDGQISLDGGTYIIDNAESVFKTDTSLTIQEGVAVTATNITGDPVVKGDCVTGSVTITNNGTFTVDGIAYTETSI